MKVSVERGCPSTRAGKDMWTEAPLIHSYVHGARRQVSKSSERVSLERHVLMCHPKEWSVVRT